MMTFFGKNLDEVSFADLIENVSIRDTIKKSELFFSERKFRECVIECAKASEVITFAITHTIPDVDEKRLAMAPLSLDVNDTFGFSDDVQDAISYIFEYLNIVKDLLIISLFKVKIDDYMKFKDTIPRVSMGSKGSFRARDKKSRYSEEEAKFCLRYVTDYALSAENQIESLKKFSLERP